MNITKFKQIGIAAIATIVLTSGMVYSQSYASDVSAVQQEPVVATSMIKQDVQQAEELKTISNINQEILYQNIKNEIENSQQLVKDINNLLKEKKEISNSMDNRGQSAKDLYEQTIEDVGYMNERLESFFNKFNNGEITPEALKADRGLRGDVKLVNAFADYYDGNGSNPISSVDKLTELKEHIIEDIVKLTVESPSISKVSFDKSVISKIRSEANSNNINHSISNNM